MNSRSCRWLIVSALLITVSGACNAPPASDQKSITTLEQQAASGDAAAQCGLGFLYFNGQGVPQDYTQGVAWWRKAAEQGDAFAQANLGIAYDYGRGVPEDHTQAVFWYRKAAEQGVAAAQSAMGATYALGHGVPQDYAQARSGFARLLSKAAPWGNTALGICTSTAKAYPRITQRPIFGTMWRLLASFTPLTHWTRNRLRNSEKTLHSPFLANNCQSRMYDGQGGVCLRGDAPCPQKAFLRLCHRMCHKVKSRPI